MGTFALTVSLDRLPCQSRGVAPTPKRTPHSQTTNCKSGVTTGALSPPLQCVCPNRPRFNIGTFVPPVDAPLSPDVAVIASALCLD
jgi:hypothetical protein